MVPHSSGRIRTRRAAIVAALALSFLTGCPGRLASKPGVYEAWTAPFARGDRSVKVSYVKPVKARSPTFLVVFATGDAGWWGASGKVFRHLADLGYYVAAYDSREVVSPVKKSDRLVAIPDAAAAMDATIVEARRALGLPESTPVIVTGFSRGANLVVFVAGVKSLQHHVAGAVAMALTRETDFLQAPPAADRPPAVQVDDKGRIQTYPAIALAGPIPFAVIQSRGDKYVPAEEARRLFGPDTPTRRLYEVDARNHGFGGGQDALIRDLDDALAWIEGKARAE